MSVPRLETARFFHRWFSFALFYWIWSHTSIKWLYSCMWQHWDENQHYQNWGTSSFENSWSVFCSMHVSKASSPHRRRSSNILEKYSQVTKRQDEELDMRMSKASSVKQVCNIRLSWNKNCRKKQGSQPCKTVFVPIFTYGMSLAFWPKEYDRKCKRSKWDFCKESKELHYLTKCVALIFENLWTSSCYFSKSRDLSLDGLAR